MISGTISAIPVLCHTSDELPCYCHYDVQERSNIYNCSSQTLETVPKTIPNFTDWILLENNKVDSLHAPIKFLDKIRFLNLKTNSISFIPGTFTSELLKSKTMKQLNLVENKLTSIPKQMQNLRHLEKIWLSGNPFHCDCEMTWMIRWLNNFTTTSGKHIVVDYQHLKCHSGKLIGLPIFVLNEVLLGCYPSDLSLGQKVGVGVGTASLSLIICILLILTLKRSREFKFFMYYYLKLDTVPKDDKNENVDNMEYDAFFCYR